MLSEEIKNLGLDGDVDDSAETLTANSTDASLFLVKPELVVFPKTVDDIKKMVKFVAAEKGKGRDISLTARSAGTDMGGGPLTESIVLSFTKYFNHLLEMGEDYAVVEPGMFYRDFEKETLKKDLLLPSYPASRELCAMGGIVNNNSGGEKTLQYGKTEKYVESISMVMEDGNEYEFSKLTKEQLDAKMAQDDFEGNLYKKMFSLIDGNYQEIMAAKPDVHKNSAGYYLWNVYDKDAQTFDLAKMICGAQGTFGMMTKAKIKLVHPKKHSTLLIIFLKDFSLLADLNNVVLPFNPESFECYDDNTLKFAVEFFPEILERLKTDIFKVIINTIPEFIMVAESGLPKMILLAEFTGETKEETVKVAELAKAALEKKFGNKLHLRVTKNDAEAEEFWVVRRESFNLLRKHVRGMRTAPFIDDFSVRADKLPEFMPKLYEILGNYKILYTIAGHIGDGNFHIIPLMDLTKPESKEIIVKLSKEVYGLIAQFHGTITSEHNDGIVRTPFLLQMYGQKICDLFAEAKRIFDPLDMFNPGKKVPRGAGEAGTMEYAENHINTQKA